MTKREVTILGAGLVGSLLAVALRKRGYEVTIYERRPDMRLQTGPAGRSINLAMSVRGWAALDLAGLRTDMEDMALPMPGRFLHQADGSTAFQAYGANGEAIYSVSRGELNKRLMTLAEAEGVKIHFEHRCRSVDIRSNVLTFESTEAGDDGDKTVKADLLIGGDGAFSALRTAYVYRDRTNASQHFIEQGYKELHIPPAANGDFQMRPDALHIWPRRQFMLIGLPNIDKSFTCTLFMNFEGAKDSFESLKTPEEINAFFDEEFPDAKALMPTLVEDFQNNPTASLITTQIDPWFYEDKSLVIGDAAHAIVPFYGQGMNAGFEDVRILMQLLETYNDDWAALMPEYSKKRQPAGDAVGELALQNFIEMRDKVADPDFLERKQVEKELTRRYPERFKSVYEMVSFSHTPYHTALRCTEAQERLWNDLKKNPHYSKDLNHPELTAALESHLDTYDEAVKNLDFDS